MRPFLWVFGLWLLGCGPSVPPLNEPTRGPSASRGLPDHQPSDQLGIFRQGTVGPYLGPTQDGWLAVWVAPDHGRAIWTSRRVNRQGTVVGPASSLALAQADTHLLKPVSLGDELLVLFSAGVGDEQRVGALSLDSAGKLASPPLAFGRAARDVVWLDAVAVGPSALVFWAERAGDSAVIYAARWEPGAARRPVRRVHAEARAWQVAAARDGALLAVIDADHEVELTQIGSDANVIDSRRLPGSHAAHPDIDLVKRGDGFVLAYAQRTAPAKAVPERAAKAVPAKAAPEHGSVPDSALERGAAQSRVVTLVLGARGQSKAAPAVATEAAGEQRLVRVLESAGRALLVWRSSASDEPMRAAWLDGEGRVVGDSTSVSSSGSMPAQDFSANSLGVAALLGGRCETAPCVDIPGVMWFESPLTPRVQPWPFKAKVGAAAGSGGPLNEAPDGSGPQPPPHMVWGLSCEAKACAGLSAELRDPIAVMVRVSTPALARGALTQTDSAPPSTEKSSSPSAQKSDAKGVQKSSSPSAQKSDAKSAAPTSRPNQNVTVAPALKGGARVAATESLVATPELADLAGLSQPEGTLLTWLTQFDPNTPYVKPDRPAPDGRWAPVQALLQTQWAPAGAELPPPQTISYRARSVAGIALAEKGNRALLVWSAIDGKSPQVFTTLLDPTGTRVRQAVQTTKSGEVLKVGASPLQEGWALAWMDDRSGQPQTYVAQLNERLKRLSPDLQYPVLEGAAADMLLAKVENETWLLVVDAAPEHSALVLQRFDAKAFLPLGSSVELARDASPVSSPTLLAQGGRVWLLWLAGVGPSAKVWLRELDAQGRALGEPSALALPGTATSLGGDCEPTLGCVYWVGQREQSRVLGGVIASRSPAAATLWQGAADAGVPLLRGDGSELWTAAPGAGVSRLRIDWRLAPSR